MTKIVALLMIGVLFFNISINCFPQVIGPVNQAKADASADMSQSGWFLLGALMPTIPIIGCLAGSVAGGSGESLGGFAPGPSDSQISCTLIGTVAGCVALPLAFRFAPIQHSPEELLGKSPEYIRTYINAYEKQTRKLRKNWGIGGMVVGTGVVYLSGRILWENL